MIESNSIKSTSPDTFLRRNNILGADASTNKIGRMPVKSIGDLDTLYQPRESTTRNPEITDPREPHNTE